MRLSPSRHDKVVHPGELLEPVSRNDRILGWITEHLGASVWMFWAALVLPLLVLPLSNTAKLILSVVSGSWFQWWMLPAIQRGQMRADAKRDAKADVDHQAMTHIAHAADELEAQLTSARVAIAELGADVRTIGDQAVRVDVTAEVARKLRAALADPLVVPAEASAWLATLAEHNDLHVTAPLGYSPLGGQLNYVIRPSGELELYLLDCNGRRFWSGVFHPPRSKGGARGD